MLICSILAKSRSQRSILRGVNTSPTSGQVLEAGHGVLPSVRQLHGLVMVPEAIGHPLPRAAAEAGRTGGAYDRRDRALGINNCGTEAVQVGNGDQ